jgi:hypothetical protein
MRCEGVVEVTPDQARREARRRSKADTTMSHCRHLEAIAREQGFKTWAAMLADKNQNRSIHT